MHFRHVSRNLLAANRRVQLVSLLVGLHGLSVLGGILFEQTGAHHLPRLSSITIDVPLVLALGFIYLSTLLVRRKHTAWAVALAAYVFLLGFNTVGVLQYADRHPVGWMQVARALLVPVFVIMMLAITRAEFRVRSDTQTFKSALRSALLILLVTLLYGVGGFMLLDKHDFHQEISAAEALHRTIDQFDLTTTHSLLPYTRRAHVFLDSLSWVSTAAVAYVVISLFQPLRARITGQQHEREAMAALLERYNAPSEEFFKLWPQDKQYFFNRSHTAGLALRVHRGVALCLSDPVGEPDDFGPLLEAFEEQCYVNDWLPSFIHIAEAYQNLYRSRDYDLQPIGQEAVVDLAHFTAEVARNKYFRNIRNRFEKQGFTAELLSPPHHPAVVERLRQVSDQWLERPGRAERGFVMGYFSEAYVQQCPIMVARDAAGTIQAFVNKIPAGFDTHEANYDMLRHTADAPPNVTDFLLLRFMATLQTQGYSRLSLGLSPLVGLEDDKATNALINRVLRFAYANGDRVYSFEGLRRFKAKYEPEWHDRFVAYKGGVRGFSRTMNALLWAMRQVAKR